jgi:hypothetical protein
MSRFLGSRCAPSNLLDERAETALHVQLGINRGPTDLPRGFDRIGGVERWTSAGERPPSVLGNRCAAAYPPLSGARAAARLLT